MLDLLDGIRDCKKEAPSNAEKKAMLDQNSVRQNTLDCKKMSTCWQNALQT